ncbi:MAG: carbon-nitrogen hydrolase family protein, partial [Planctomycetales bacterium]|nr:carbon-nitrogen hydrolase family protein [Planctomycetales bacterium]
MSDIYRIAGVQMDVAFADKAANLERIERRFAEATDGGAFLTVFPECVLTGYCFDSYEEAWPYAEPIPGPSTDRLTELCHQHGAYLVAGMLEADGERLFNACVLVGPQGLVGVYRKVHLPGLGVDHFTHPGDRPFEVWTIDDLRVGMNICYDGSFPEASRVMALAGADLIVLPTNWPPPARSFAEHVINARAMESNVYYLSANRIGEERGFEFIGTSRLCDPFGGTMAELPPGAEGVFYGDVRPDLARTKRLIR